MLKNLKIKIDWRLVFYSLIDSQSPIHNTPIPRDYGVSLFLPAPNVRKKVGGDSKSEEGSVSGYITLDFSTLHHPHDPLNIIIPPSWRCRQIKLIPNVLLH